MPRVQITPAMLLFSGDLVSGTDSILATFLPLFVTTTSTFFSSLMAKGDIEVGGRREVQDEETYQKMREIEGHSTRRKERKIGSNNGGDRVRVE